MAQRCTPATPHAGQGIEHAGAGVNRASASAMRQPEPLPHSGDLELLHCGSDSASHPPLAVRARRLYRAWCWPNTSCRISPKPDCAVTPCRCAVTARAAAANN